MMITVCDGCGRHLSAWVRVETQIGASRDYANIGDLQNYQHRIFHFCGNCAARLLKTKEGNDA